MIDKVLVHTRNVNTGYRPLLPGISGVSRIDMNLVISISYAQRTANVDVEVAGIFMGFKSTTPMIRDKTLGPSFVKITQDIVFSHSIGSFDNLLQFSHLNFSQDSLQRESLRFYATMGLLSTALLLEVYSQLFTRPPFPTNDFTGKTILVTGANVGLGKEATAHFVRLGAAKVIVAVRSIEKGEAAKREIETALERPNIIEILELDLSKYSSVKNFAANLAQRYDRIDHAVMNASIATEDYETFEDNESTITVNVVSTTYLILLLLPILRKSATKYQTTPIISVVSSGVHAYTTFPERKTPSPFATLNDPKLAVMTDR